MADLADVETALVALSSASLGLVPAPSPRVYRGWPASAALDADLVAGLVNVSVFSVPDTARNTTRWPVLSYAAASVPTLTVSVSGNVATFGGTADAGQVAGVLVFGEAFTYATGPRDTPATVAAVLASEIRAVASCVASGASVTVAGVTSVVARTMAFSSAVSEWGRQLQTVRVTVWAPAPDVRDATAGALWATFASTPFLTLADGSAARLRTRSASVSDAGADAGLFRRDLLLDVEYGTTITSLLPCMLFGVSGLNGSERIT